MSYVYGILKPCEFDNFARNKTADYVEKCTEYTKNIVRLQTVTWDSTFYVVIDKHNIRISSAIYKSRFHVFTSKKEMKHCLRWIQKHK